MTERYQRNPNTKCVICGKPIYRRPIEIQRNNGSVYCGMACYGRACRKENPCLVCGKPILATFNKKTCSRHCANIHRTGIRYKLNRPRDKVVLERAMKLRLIELRGMVCERCGYKKLEILQVHHKDRNRKNNDVSNLELVCPNCHYEEHYLQKSWLKNNGGVG
jgi:predicted nucleic acid-binding Zn ribbon protein